MSIYLIVGMIDEGLSCHYTIEGDNILDACMKELVNESGYIMGWDFKDYLMNKKIAFGVNDEGHIVVEESILRNFCKNILEYMFESRVDGDSNAGYAIFDITKPMDTFVVKEDAIDD